MATGPGHPRPSSLTRRKPPAQRRSAIRRSRAGPHPLTRPHRVRRPCVTSAARPGITARTSCRAHRHDHGTGNRPAPKPIGPSPAWDNAASGLRWPNLIRQTGETTSQGYGVVTPCSHAGTTPGEASPTPGAPQRTSWGTSRMPALTLAEHAFDEPPLDGAPTLIAQRPGPPAAQVLVAVPAHNEESRIAATIESLFAQTRRPDEIVVVRRRPDRADRTPADGPARPRRHGDVLQRRRQRAALSRRCPGRNGRRAGGEPQLQPPLPRPAALHRGVPGAAGHQPDHRVYGRHHTRPVPATVRPDERPTRRRAPGSSA
jgi:hypothetical protein